MDTVKTIQTYNKVMERINFKLYMDFGFLSDKEIHKAQKSVLATEMVSKLIDTEGENAPEEKDAITAIAETLADHIERCYI